MSAKTRRSIAMVFTGVVILSGGLQLLAYAAKDGTWHLIAGIVAIAIGLRVLVGIMRAPGEGGDPEP